jgi:hypothetical protein
MSTIQTTKMTVLYVASTGHIVSAITRTEASGPSPSIADLVGDNLHLQLGPTTQLTPPIPVSTFFIPATDLKSVDVDFDILGPNPWGRVMNLAGTSSSPVLGDPPVLPPLTRLSSTPTASYTAPAVTVNFPSGSASGGSAYYIIVSQPFTVTGFPTTAKGTLPATLSSAANPLSLGNVRSGTYPVLILIQNVLPYVATFVVP